MVSPTPFIGAMWIVIPLQIRSGLRQSWHFGSPTVQGVFLFSRRAFSGAAMFLARHPASCSVGANLLRPAIRYSFCGPYSVAATRLPVPSMLTVSRVSAMPLALQSYPSARPACSASAGDMLRLRAYTVQPCRSSISASPIWATVMLPPMPTVLPRSSSASAAAASDAVA